MGIPTFYPNSPFQPHHTPALFSANRMSDRILQYAVVRRCYRRIAHREVKKPYIVEADIEL